MKHSRDGRNLIVVARRDNACRILDLRSGAIGPTILLGNGPYTVAAP